MASKKPTKKTDYSELLARAKKRFEDHRGRDSENRKRQEEDTRFVYEAGAQWPTDTRKEREAAGDPCMEFPQLKQFLSQVVNQQRQQRPGITVYGVTGDASDETAELIQGVIRGIERDSRAEAVYDNGYHHEVLGGRGYWRVLSEYESPTSFNQKLVIRWVPDPLSVDLDPNYIEPDGSDRSWAFISETVTDDEFKRRWPKAEPLSIDTGSKWYPADNEVVIADYYERERVEKRLLLLADGKTVGFEDDLRKQYGDQLDGMVARERMAETFRVCWYKIAGGDQVLEEYDWPGTIIPVVCAIGDHVIIDGKWVFQGLITQARDTQTLFNFGMTQQAVHLALSPRAPFLAAAEAVAGREKMWKTANKANWSTLIYNAFRKDGSPIPPPIKTQLTQIDSGWLNWTQQMTGLMRSIIGMYENSLGMHSQEVSGKAIIAREEQGDQSTFHFLDNFSRAIALTGRILLECIPTYYDTERIVTIVGEDGEAKPQTINQSVAAPTMDDPYAAIRIKDITVGKYAVSVEAGPGYATKRKELAAMTLEMVKAFPQMLQFAGDVVMRAQDLPEADELADRFKAMLPPPIQQMLAAKDQGQNPQVASLNAQLQTMGQQLQQLQQQLQMVGMENQQLKLDKSASIAASNARTEQAHASVQAQEMAAQNEQMQIIANRLDNQEKRAIERDKVMADILKTLIDAQVSQQQVAQQAQQEATAAMQANP